MKRKTVFTLGASIAVIIVAGALVYSFTNQKPPQQKTQSINLDGLFSDQGQLYFSPQEPTAKDAVHVTLRSTANNLTGAALVVTDTKTKQTTTIAMKKAGSGRDKQFDYWTGTIPPNQDATQYYFIAKNGLNKAYFSANGATSMLPSVGMFTITPGFTTPTWAQQGVMYQIFVDRFDDGNPANDIKTGAYQWYGSTATHLAWGTDPETGDQGGKDQVTFFGGDLQGIQSKLPYINQQLGANILYLTPIFDAKTNHRYGVDNYFQVAPSLGGDAALSALTTSAHSDGDKVILDGVFNHTGASNPWFQDALSSKSNPFYKWYTFSQYPTDYATFAGVKNLPKLNYGNPAVLKEVDKIAKYWLQAPFNADGWRLDSPGHVGAQGDDPESYGNTKDTTNHTVWESFRSAVKSVKSQALIVGEYFENTIATSWLQGNQWDGSVNYGGFLEPVTDWITGRDVNMNAATVQPSDLENTLFEDVNSIPRPAQLVQVNQLGTQDTARFGERAAKQINYKNYLGQTFPYGGTPNYRKDVLGAMFQMTFTGLPTIYYGDEYGMMGGGTNDAGKRWTFNWSKVGNRVFLAYQQLITMRKHYSALADGSFMPLEADDTTNTFAFARFDKKNRILVLMNDSNQPHKMTVNVAQAGSLNGSKWSNITPLLKGITESTSVATDGRGEVTVTIPANYGVILEQAGGALYSSQ